MSSSILPLLVKSPQPTTITTTTTTFLLFLLVSTSITYYRKKLLHNQKKIQFLSPEWQYAAEGALNIALRYVGTTCPNLIGHILRLRKDQPTSIKKTSTYSLTTTVDFIESTMVPLLGREYVPKNELISIPQTFLQEIDEMILNQRPHYRRHHALDLDSQVGVLMKDHARLICSCGNSCTSYCVEIKPKWGILFPESSWEVKRRVDRFTMHQQFKFFTSSTPTSSLFSSTNMTRTSSSNVDESQPVSFLSSISTIDGSLSSTTTAFSPTSSSSLQTQQQQQQQNHQHLHTEISLYNPLELFHGNIKLAIHQLIQTPQNNLRLFKDGIQIYPLHNNKSNNVDSISNDIIIFDVLAIILEKENILKRLVNAQICGNNNTSTTTNNNNNKYAPKYSDIEYVYPLYQEYISNNNNNQPPTPKDNLSKEEAQIIKNFLTSCTARDCSIMVSMSTCQHLKFPTKGTIQLNNNNNSNVWQYDIAIVDLDPKPIEKMRSYYETDMEIASLYTRLEETNQLM
jgi:hypothetical protein